MPMPPKPVPSPNPTCLSGARAHDSSTTSWAPASTLSAPAPAPPARLCLLHAATPSSSAGATAATPHRPLRNRPRTRVITPQCIVDPMADGADIHASREYRAIAAHYGRRAAARSGVPYLHHIDEGLVIMTRHGATNRAMRAFCLHPLLQNDADLVATYPNLASISDDAQVLALALEYRAVANAALSQRALASAADIALSPLAEVNQMLVADKIQNYKDFILHHRGRHPRSAALERYFQLWLERLGIDAAAYARLSADL